MTLFGIALRSLRSRALSTALTAASVALGVGLVVFVTTARTSADRAFHRAARGYDVVVGGVHTTPLSTVLSTVFHVDVPLDTVPIGSYLSIARDPRVRHAVPYALGDMLGRFRVVGTTPTLFDALMDDEDRPLRESIRPKGRVFDAGPEEKFEAVVGAVVAAERGYSLGDTFDVTHGLEGEGHVHEDVWTIVGILDPTGTPVDQVAFIQLESFFHVEGHAAPPGEGGGDSKAPWAVSSIVVRLKAPHLRDSFVRDVRGDENLQAAVPFQEIRKLFAIVGHVEALFRAVALVVVLVFGLAVFLELYDSVRGRRREIALLRAVGARRAQVVGVVVTEALLVVLAGGVAGLLLGHAALAVASPVLLDRFGVRLATGFGSFDLLVLAALVGTALVVSAVPAWRAFRVPVAENLLPTD
jgi:putative ABC transport system permease protein